MEEKIETDSESERVNGGGAECETKERSEGYSSLSLSPVLLCRCECPSTELCGRELEAEVVGCEVPQDKHKYRQVQAHNDKLYTLNNLSS